MTYPFTTPADKLRRAAARHVGAICSRLNPGGTAQDGRYYLRKPWRLRRREPLVISLATGSWVDFATGTNGPCVVSFIACALKMTEARALRLISQIVHFRPSVRLDDERLGFLNGGAA